MKKKRTLSMDDQKAIDILLDHSAKADQGLTAVAPTIAPARLQAVTRLLSLLNQIPDMDPPRDLVAKTMKRIDHHQPQAHAPRHHASPTVTPLH